MEVIDILVLVTYDVSVTDVNGAARLRRVAKLCERYGIRVQNSVFEVLVDATQLYELKRGLESEIDADVDSVRFYRLGNSYKSKVETLGKVNRIETGAPIIL